MPSQVKLLDYRLFDFFRSFVYSRFSGPSFIHCESQMSSELIEWWEDQKKQRTAELQTELNYLLKKIDLEICRLRENPYVNIDLVENYYQEESIDANGDDLVVMEYDDRKWVFIFPRNSTPLELIQDDWELFTMARCPVRLQIVKAYFTWKEQRVTNYTRYHYKYLSWGPIELGYKE